MSGCRGLLAGLPSHADPAQGGTDAEKHRDLLAAENERLRQEMKAREGELRELRRQQAACRDCTHLQVSCG